MKKKFKLGVIGGGFMSSAIINGAINGKVVKPKDILVSDVNETSLEKFNKLGIKTTLSNKEVFSQSEFVLFAVKPQNFADVFVDILDVNSQKVISIMAGVKKEKIKKYLTNAKVARCMPNTPCSVGSGAVGIDLTDFTEQKDVDFITKLFASFSKVALVDEKNINAVTGISGSAPAYFYLFIKGVIEAGVENGLSYDDSFSLAVNTMIGSGKMLKENKEKTIDELINAVCSKGGTTIEAVKVYNENNLSDITKKAINACIGRAKELEN